MKQLGVGVVGCGRIAQLVHLPALAAMPNVRLAALADPDAAQRAAAARHAPRAAPYEDHEALVASADVDAIVVCLPTALHAPAAVAAFGAGKHVYLEKPIAADLSGGDAVVDAWQRAGTLGMIGFNFRFHPLYEELHRLVAGGAVGTPLGVRTVFSSAARALQPWKQRRASGGGVLLDLASHHVDLVRFVLDDEVEEVQARTESRRSEDDTAVVQMRMRSGALVQSFVSAASVGDHRVEVFGDAGVARVDLAAARRVELVRQGGGSPRVARLARALRALDPRIHVRPPWHDPSFARALGAFVAAARAGDAGGAGSEGFPDLADGHRSLAAVLAAESSARAGRAVRLDEVTPGMPPAVPDRAPTLAGPGA